MSFHGTISRSLAARKSAMFIGFRTRQTESMETRHEWHENTIQYMSIPPRQRAGVLYVGSFVTGERKT